MKGKLIVFCVIAALVAAFFFSPLSDELTLGNLEKQQARIDAYYVAHPGRTVVIYFAIYVAVTSLSLPGAGIMTLAAGAIFGLLWGAVIASFAATIGASLAFLISRFLFRDFVQRRFGGSLRVVNEGIKRDGAFYLLFLRLVPAFPYFVINVVMGLTPMSVLRFALVSQIGMLPGTIIFVNAGTQLRTFELSVGLFASLVLLGVFPFIAKRAVEAVKAHHVLKPYARPARFERSLVVIGAGAAGLVTSYIAAAVKAKVTLVEQHKMCGDCLNTGCLPSKALIRSAKFLSHARRATELGFKSAEVDFVFADVMERIQRVVRTVEPHDSVERYTELGVECVQGTAKISSPYTVEVNGRTISTKNIVVAAGGRPLVPPIPGIEEVGYLTSDTLWDLRKLPARLLVLGGGPIGSELAQCFARFGSQVIQVELLPRILICEDPEISAMVHERFVKEGIDVRVNHRAKQFCMDDGKKTVVCEHEGKDLRLEFDELLVAVGRAANLSGYGLEELGVPVGNTRKCSETWFVGAR